MLQAHNSAQNKKNSLLNCFSFDSLRKHLYISTNVSNNDISSKLKAAMNKCETENLFYDIKNYRFWT